MAIALDSSRYVHTSSPTTGTACSTASFTPPSGSDCYIVVLVASANATSGLWTVEDSVNGTTGWVRLASNVVTGPNADVEVWYHTSPGAAMTVTARPTHDAFGFTNVGVLVFTGAGAPTNYSTTQWSGAGTISLTTTSTSPYVVGAVANDDTSNTAAASPDANTTVLDDYFGAQRMTFIVPATQPTSPATVTLGLTNTNGSPPAILVEVPPGSAGPDSSSVLPGRANIAPSIFMPGGVLQVPLFQQGDGQPAALATLTQDPSTVFAGFSPVSPVLFSPGGVFQVPFAAKGQQTIVALVAPTADANTSIRGGGQSGAGLFLPGGTSPFLPPPPFLSLGDTTIAAGILSFITVTATQAQAAVVNFINGRVIAATQAQTVTVVRSVGKVIAATQNQAASVLRSVGRVITATQAQSATVVRSVGRIITATQAQAASVVKGLAYLVTVTATQAQSSIVVRSVGKIITATQAQSSTLTRTVGRVVTATQAQAATTARSIGRALTATQTQASSVARSVGRVVTATQAQSATARRTVGKVITATQAQSATVVKGLAYLVTVTATQAQSVTVRRSIGKVITATQAQTATVTRTVNRIISAPQAQVGSVLRTVGRTLSATQAQSASVAKGRIVPIIVAATQAQAGTVAFVKNTFAGVAGAARDIARAADTSARYVDRFHVEVFKRKPRP